MATTKRAGFGCLVLFLTPFALGGTLAAAQGVREAAAGEWRQAAFLGVFALVFGGVGFGGMAAGLAGATALAVTRLGFRFGRGPLSVLGDPLVLGLLGFCGLVGFFPAGGIAAQGRRRRSWGLDDRAAR